MKAIISTTYDDNYLFFLPITTWAWNKLGVDVICFIPETFEGQEEWGKLALLETIRENLGLRFTVTGFYCPANKLATYAQCSRLYGGALDFIPDDEYLVTSDVDMAVFAIPAWHEAHKFTVFGADLVPEKQHPMCYITATKKNWNKEFFVWDRTVQKCLDDLLGDIDCENMRGNYWGKDQETAYDFISEATLVNRTNGQSPFATRRLDRDDAYILERDATDVIDYHMNRPGFDHIETIVAIFQKKYPHDDFQWMIDYANEYKKLL